MTIKFYCPNCGALIAFPGKHAGKRAHCLTCGQPFIIPYRDNETPQKIEPKIEKAEPLPGFYHAVFVDSCKLFIDPENVTTLAFVIAVVCFKFFLAKAVCCMNYISFMLAWGWLFGFYLNVIHETAFGLDKLPEIYLGTVVTFLWYIIKPFFVFFLTMIVVQLPFIAVVVFLQHKGLTYDYIHQAPTALRLLLYALFVFGLFFFPIAILTTAVAKDFAMLRPDYLLVPIFKAFIPYLVPVVLLTAFGLLEMHTPSFAGLKNETFLSAAAGLSLNLLLQALAIIAMRSIGLFYRHYSCHLKW